jgi:uncharacterized metal-binding protein
MSSGNFHEGFNLAILSISFFALLSAGFVLGAVFLFYAECVLFGLHGYFHTMYVNPDSDTKSNASKRMGKLGKLIDLIFPHRGLLHNPLFWVILYFLIGYEIYLEYGYVMWWCLGGIEMILSHLIVDKISTGKKRFLRKVKKALNPVTWIKKCNPF